VSKSVLDCKKAFRVANTPRHPLPVMATKSLYLDKLSIDLAEVDIVILFFEH
jgi:hypothetical protein